MKYKIEQGNEGINSIGGICLIGGILNKRKQFESINKMEMPRTKKGLIPHGDILKSMIGLYCLGKNIFTGITSHRRPVKCKSDKPLFAVFEVIERITDAAGEPFLIPNIEVNTWWTNIPDDAPYIIDFYHQQGSSEQFHSELKSGNSFTDSGYL